MTTTCTQLCRVPGLTCAQLSGFLHSESLIHPDIQSHVLVQYSFLVLFWREKDKIFNNNNKIKRIKKVT